MAEHDLDVLVVSGSEYCGFEGAVTYLSGFQIVHRYAYVVIPADGDTFVVFPQEARYVGEHGTTPLEQVFHARPGELIAARAKDAGWRRVGVFGLDYIMAVRDFTAIAGLELVPFESSSTTLAPSRAGSSWSRFVTRFGSTSVGWSSGRSTMRPARRPPR